MKPKNKSQCWHDSAKLPCEVFEERAGLAGDKERVGGGDDAAEGVCVCGERRCVGQDEGGAEAEGAV